MLTGHGDVQRWPAGGRGRAAAELVRLQRSYTAGALLIKRNTVHHYILQLATGPQAPPARRPTPESARQLTCTAGTATIRRGKHTVPIPSAKGGWEGRTSARFRVAALSTAPHAFKWRLCSHQSPFISQPHAEDTPEPMRAVAGNGKEAGGGGAEGPGRPGVSSVEVYGFVGWITSAVAYGESGPTVGPCSCRRRRRRCAPAAAAMMQLATTRAACAPCCLPLQCSSCCGPTPPTTCCQHTASLTTPPSTGRWRCLPGHASA